MEEDPLDVETNPQPVDLLESGPRETSETVSDTVGTGTSVAVSCSVLAAVVTLLLIAGLLIARWLS